MPDATLTYDSCGNWMRLTVFGRNLVLNYYNYGEYSPVGLFREIAEEALRMGFSLRAGNRATKGIPLLIEAISDPGDKSLLEALHLSHINDWCPPSPEKKKK